MDQGRTEKQKNESQVDMIIFLAVVVIFTLLTIVSFYLFFQNAKQNVLEGRQKEAVHMSMEMDTFLVESKDAVRIAAYEVGQLMEKEASSEELLAALANESQVYTKAVDSYFTGIYGVINGEYMDGIGWTPEGGYVPENRPWYKKAIEAGGEVAVVPPYLDMQTGEIMISVSRMLADRKSVVALDIDLASIQQMVELSAEKNGWDTGMVLTDGGLVVAHTDLGEKGKNYFEETGTMGSQIAGLLLAGGQEQQEDGEDIGNVCYSVRMDGKKYYVLASRSEAGWYSVAVLQENQAIGSLKIVYLFSLLTVGLSVLLLCMVFTKIGRKRQELDKMNRQLHAVASIYASVHFLELETDTFSEVSSTADDIRLLVGNRHEHAQNVLRMTMDSLTDERYKQRMFRFIELSTLSERMEKADTIANEFYDNKNNRCRGRFVAVDRKEDGSVKNVLWMVEIID